MKYVVTFEDYDSGAISVVVDAPYMEYAIVEAKERANEGGGNYCDCDVLSVVRI